MATASVQNSLLLPTIYVSLFLIIMSKLLCIICKTYAYLTLKFIFCVSSCCRMVSCWKGCDCQLAQKLGPGNQRLSAFLSLDCMFCPPFLQWDPFQGLNLERAICCWTAHGTCTQLRPLCKFLRFVQVGVKIYLSHG